MKKAYLAAVLCCAALLLGACGSTDAAEPTPQGAPAETAAPAALANPVHETDAEGLTQATGLSLTAPEGAEGVRYSYLTLTDAPPIAELRFTLGGDALLLRAQSGGPAESDDISGLSYDWTLIQAAEVHGCGAVIYLGGEAGHIDWVDAAPGIHYDLGMRQGASAEKLTAYAERVFAPLQADKPAATPDPLYAPYRDLVSRIAQALEDGRAADLVAEPGISEVFRVAEKGDYGWLQQDINHDGVDELLLGRIAPADEPSPFYDIYTMLGGEMVHLSTGWDYNHWYLLADGIFVNEWHGTANDTYRTPYGLFNGKFVPANRYVEPGEYIHIDFRDFDTVSDKAV